MNKFDKAFDLLLEHEGGYSNHLHDPGGKTMFGITERTARDYGYTGNIKDLPLDVAKEIYKNRYWNIYFDSVPFSIAFNVFDGAVNSGSNRSIKWLQKSVYIEIDGIFGSETHRAILYREPSVIVCRYNAERLEYLTNLSTWRFFGKGWSRRIAKNLTV